LLSDNNLLRSRVDEAEASASRFAAAGVLAAAAAAEAAEAAAQPKPDDLTLIEGIGPKIAELLEQNGIATFAALAETSVDDLDTILRSGGSRFQTADPGTWPRQARLAANRDWPRLDLLKAQLKGGVRRPQGDSAASRSQAVPEPQDDLAVIEGIGPKIAEILYANGIRTYAQLARMESARLRLLLNEAGPAYRVADPTTWPEQASWAAVGNWERLQALKDELDAGRRGE
jgi:predicted flap endonuclease-1-like 5' DNA nuclease